MTNKSDKQIEPYQPNYSEKLEPAPPPSAPGGCLRTLSLYLLLPLMLTCIIVLTIGLLGIGQFGKTFKDVTESNGFCLFNCGDNTVEVDIQQIVLGFQQQAWLESGREQQQIELTASDQVQLGGVVPVPASRELKYRAYVVVTAGIDLQLLDEQNFRIEDNQLVITLPQAQLKDCILDLENSIFYDLNYYCGTVGGCGDLETLLQSQALETAATRRNDEIRALAYSSAQDTVRDLAQQFGFSGEVIIEQSTESLPVIANGGTCYQAPTDPALVTPAPASTPQ